MVTRLSVSLCALRKAELYIEGSLLSQFLPYENKSYRSVKGNKKATHNMNKEKNKTIIRQLDKIKSTVYQIL